MKRPDLLLPRAASLAGWQNLTAAGSRWDFNVCNGKPHLVSARLEDGALELSVGPLEKTRTRWAMLAANRDLPPPARLVLNWRDELQLRSEMVFDDDCPDEVLGSVLSSVTAGLEEFTLAPNPVDTASESWDAEGAAAEAGLAGRKLPDGRFRLDSGGATPRAATLGPDPAARVKMLPAGEYTATVREAVATLLLRMTSVVRFARATAWHDGSAWLEVRWVAGPSVAEMQAAVSALALAARCTEELAVLTREEAASIYLAAGESAQKGGDQSCQSLLPM